jgi:hypothetical protein
MWYVFTALNWLGLILVAHSLMLLGADEITTIEEGGILTVRSLGRILTLYGADPLPWLGALSGVPASALASVLSWPAWAVLFFAGGFTALVTRERM